MPVRNSWNRVVYRFWAPIYDSTVGRLFLPGRRRALELLNLKPGERVLLLGVGTGADLPFLPEGVLALGIDLSPAMLRRARARLPLPESRVLLVRGDAQERLVCDQAFDAAILHLILSVVPDGRACLRFALRALKPGGRAVVFDKFVQGQAGPTPLRRLLNIGSTLLGTDITRRFEDLAEGCEWSVVHDEPGMARGAYRVIVLTRSARTPEPD